MLTAVATKSLKIVIFKLVDANCDDSVTIPRCPNLVVDLKVSVALKKKFFTHILGTPLFQILDPPLQGLEWDAQIRCDLPILDELHDI